MSEQKTLNVGEVVGAQNSIEGLILADRERKLDIPLSGRVRIADIVRSISLIVKRYSAQRHELVKKYGTPVSGKPDEIEVKGDAENRPQFDEENNALLSVSTPVAPQWVQITKKALGNAQIDMELLAVLRECGVLVID